MFIWKMIWDLSEWSGIGLGKYSHVVFEKMIGVKGQEIDSLGNPLKKMIDPRKIRIKDRVLKMTFDVNSFQDGKLSTLFTWYEGVKDKETVEVFYDEDFKPKG